MYTVKLRYFFNGELHYKYKYFRTYAQAKNHIKEQGYPTEDYKYNYCAFIIQGYED